MEFVSRQENQPQEGEITKCDFCENEIEAGYYYNFKQVACSECIFEYLKKEMHLEYKLVYAINGGVDFA